MPPFLDFFLLGETTDLPWANGIITLAQMGGAVALVWYYNTIHFPRVQKAFDDERAQCRDYAIKREEKIEELLEKTIECIVLNKTTLDQMMKVLEDIKNKKG